MKIFEGVVISVKMNNTAVVEITRRTPHPMYGKLIKSSKKYKVDSTGADIVVGQMIKIVETRPFSKGKFFKVADSKKQTAKVEKDEVKTTPVAKPKKAAAVKKVTKPRAKKEKK